jgi:dihydrofolate reductase
MTDTDVVAFLAVSLDGYVAQSDGGVGFLEKYPLEDFDMDGFIEGVGALVMGSATYEQSVEWGWNWGDLPTLVLTSRSGLPVPEGADIRFSSEPTPDAIRGFAAETPKRLWVFGGGKVVTDGLRGGAIDTLDINVMPEALGSGVPLFTDSYSGPMKLSQTMTYANGAVRLIYKPSTIG